MLSENVCKQLRKTVLKHVQATFYPKTKDKKNQQILQIENKVCLRQFFMTIHLFYKVSLQPHI